MLFQVGGKGVILWMEKFPNRMPVFNGNYFNNNRVLDHRPALASPEICS